MLSCTQITIRRGGVLKGLMHICRNWGDNECHSEVGKWRYSKQLKDREDIPIMPIGEGLERIDEICKQCETRFFEIDTKRCPVCEGENFLEVTGFVILDKKDKKNFENFYLKCTQCETPSVLLRQQ